MNLAAPNSGGFATSPPPVSNIEIEILLPDGSCIPATRANARRVLKQVRSVALKARKARRQEIADELQRNLEDRRAARDLLDELAGYERDRWRMAAVLRGKVKPDRSAQEASPVRKRRVALKSSVFIKSQQGSSWAIDDRGMRGVGYHQSYLSRKSPSFYRGAASDRWMYDVRDEAIMRDADGNVVWFSNLGDDIDEVAEAWQAIEDATTRKNGKVQIRIIVPCDADASPDEKAEALRLFCEQVLAPMGLPYSAVMHHAPEDGNERNDHGHILTNLRPTRRVAPYCWSFADEVRGELDGKNGVQMLRHLWAHSMSEAAEKSGRNMRYTGLSYAARGLALEAGEHLGEARSAMVARGEHVWAHERNRIKNARNAQRLILRDIDRKMAALVAMRDMLIAERDAPVCPARQILSACADPATRPLPLRSTGVASNAGAALVPANDAATRDTLVAASRPPVFKPGIAPVSSAGKRQPLISAIQLGPMALHRPQRLFPAAVPGRSAHPRTPAPSMPPPRLAPLSASSPRTPIEWPALSASSRGVGGKTPLNLVSGPASRRPKLPPVIVETMQEVVQRLAMYRRAKAADPAVAALRRRRALADNQYGPERGQVVPARLWLELNPLTACTRTARERSLTQDREKLERIASGQGYVSERPDGVLVQAIHASDEPAPDEQWWSQAHVRRSLAALRAQQRALIEQALHTSGTDVALDLGRAPIVWPTALKRADRVRLDRWSQAPTFRTDLTVIARRLTPPPLEQQSPAASLQAQTNRSAASQPDRIPDGFGGWRDTPPPAFTGATPPVRVPAFDRRTGGPTDHLLRLLLLAGEHPRGIEVASDGKLMAVITRPALLAPLLHGWRDDERVSALVTETVRYSRNAGRPGFPIDIASAVRSFVMRDAKEVEAGGGANGKGAAKTRLDPGRLRDDSSIV